MKKRLRKMKRAVGILLSVVCLIQSPLLEVSAAEQSLQTEGVEVLESYVSELPEGFFEHSQNTRAAFSDCTIVIGFKSDGMHITCFTGTNATVPVVGVKDIRVEQKVWYGWKLVAVASGGQDTDTNGLGVSVVYENAVKGETYRVSCVHYADLVYDGVESYVEGSNSTGEFVFTY